MSIEEINGLVSPPRAHKQVVSDWVNTCAKHVSDFGDALEVTASASCVESLFDTTMFHYTHNDTGGDIVRQAGAMSLPAAVSEYVDLVEGLSNFPVPHYKLYKKHTSRRLSPTATTLASDDAVIAQTLFSMYNIPLPIPQTEATQTTVQFDGQNFSPDELATYGQDVNIETQTITTIVGSNNPSSPGDESQMDVEMMGTINNGAETWFWIEPNTAWLYLYSVHVMNTQTVPMVHSISYGWSEMNECDINPAECQKLGISSQGYVSRTNTEFQKIGLRGVTLVAASADSGANGRTDEACTLSYLKPAFPASSPYVTAVGATQVNDAEYNLDDPPSACDGFSCISGGSEVAVSYAVSGFASGGGFSVFSSMPSYQKTAVNSYIGSNPPHLPPKSYYNGTNRGYPDVASLGHNCLILENENLQVAGGTSCSAPSFAAIVAILNQASLAKTGKPLGFLNPFLYQMWTSNPDTFTDITVGDNHCTEQGCKATCKGFWCTQGWDPVTGLGSPNVANILDYINNNLKAKTQ